VSETVELTRPAPNVALVVLNRPERLNALNYPLVADLHRTLDAIASDRTIRCVVVTGAGRAFCAGLDVQEGAFPPDTDGLSDMRRRYAQQQHIASLVPKLRSLPQPVIAAVNGPATGGGFAIALASDIRIASESACFNAAFVKVGISGCDLGVGWLLPRLIGASAAFHLMLTGELIDSDEAYRLRVVSRIVPDGTVVDTALVIAASINANSPTGVWMTKEVMWSQLEVGSLQAGIDLENRTQVLCQTTGDMDEAMAAFLEKRQPRFAD
jgi:enoyl-CoA hydratase